MRKRYLILGFCAVFLNISSGMDCCPSEEDVRGLYLRDGESIRAEGRPLRIDLIWEKGSMNAYEVQRSIDGKSDWQTLDNPTAEFHLYTDFIGEPGKTYYYRIRNIGEDSKRPRTRKGGWSQVVSATSLSFDEDSYLDDLQETSIRYFTELAHPYSGMSREGAPGWDGISAMGATGMGLSNLIVGDYRKFISRETAVDIATRILAFLEEKADPDYGVFVHWMDGSTGKLIQFSQDPENFANGADLVETSFLAQGCILVREYFDRDTPEEIRLRKLADKIWKEIEWDKFVTLYKGHPSLMWHYLRGHGLGNLMIRGWNECMISYVLGVASPTYPIDPDIYRTGWFHSEVGLGDRREQYGVVVDLEWEVGWPLFFAHYSFMGFDPRALDYRGRSYFEHIKDAVTVQVRYARGMSGQHLGYGEMWGLTASVDPDGYKAHSPGEVDNGTLTPTASLASMPYAPTDVMRSAKHMYLKHGNQLYGVFGFYDAFNFDRDWVSHNYLGIDVGPIAPMIENHRSGLLWNLFMQAPEIQQAVKKMRALDLGKFQ